MRRFFLASLMGMLIGQLAFAQTTIKSQIGEEDLNTGRGTFQRRTSTGGTIELNRINAGSIPVEYGTGTLSVDGALSGWADVRAYGAVGDNVTNDTAAIQAAIDTGLPVYIPAGIYAVDTINVHGFYRIIMGAGGAATLYSGYHLYPGGDDSGSGQSTILRARGTGPVLDVQLHQNSFYNISFDGNYTADNVVLLHPYTTKTLFSRCSFSRHATGGKQVVVRDADTVGEIIQDDFNMFERSYFYGYDNTGTGLYILGSNTQKQKIDRCYFSNLSSGIYVRGGSFDVIDSQFEQMDWAAMNIYGGGAPGRIIGNYTETSGMYFIRMADSTGGGDETLIVQNNWINTTAYNVFWNYYTIISIGNLYKGDVTFNTTAQGTRSKPVISIGDTFANNAVANGDYATNVLYFGTFMDNVIKVRAAPANSTEACVKGLTTFDNNYKYWCYADNNWRRVAYDNTF